MAVIRLPDKIFTGDYSDVVTPVSGDNGKALVWNAAAQRTEWVSVAASPGGSNGQVQYNNGGVFAGHSGFVYDGAGKVTLSAALVSPVWKPASDSTTALKIQNSSGNTTQLTVNTVDSSVSVSRKFSVNLTAINGNETVDQFVIHSSGDANWRGARFQWSDSDGTSNVFGFRVEGYNVGGGAATRLVRLNFLNLTGLIITGLTDYVWQFPSIFSANAGIAGTYHSDLPIILRQHTNGGANKAIKFYTQDKTTVRMAIYETGLVSIGTHEAGALLDIAASTTSAASLRIRSGTAPTTPNTGDLWFDGTNLKFYDGSATKTITWT